MLEELYAFFKHPSYMTDTNKGFQYRLRKLFKLVVLAIGLSILLLMAVSTLQLVFGLELGKHAIDDLVGNNSAILIFILAVVVAPVVEELIFRGPLVWFKKSNYFPIVFYLFSICFGFVHLTNFELTTQVWILSPFLVAPQISVGVLLGFIRVKFGLLWSMALHASYNSVFIFPLLVMKLLGIPIA